MSDCNKHHAETGSPFPYWLEMGFPGAEEKKQAADLIEQLFGQHYHPLPATNWKYHYGSYVLMFRSQDDRFLYEISSQKKHERINPSYRNSEKW